MHHAATAVLYDRRLKRIANLPATQARRTAHADEAQALHWRRGGADNAATTAVHSRCAGGKVADAATRGSSFHGPTGCIPPAPRRCADTQKPRYARV